MVDLGGGRHGQVELGREMQVKIEVLLGVDGIGVCEARGGRDHEEGESLGAGGR